MGIYGYGNFEEDAAAEYLVEFTRPILLRIREAMEGEGSQLEPDEWTSVVLLADLEILATLADGLAVGSTPGFVPSLGLPDVHEINLWKEKYMAIWDRSIDGLLDSSGDPGFKVKRRRAITYTFTRLSLASRREHAQ